MESRGVRGNDSAVRLRRRAFVALTLQVGAAIVATACASPAPASAPPTAPPKPATAPEVPKPAASPAAPAAAPAAATPIAKPATTPARRLADTVVLGRQISPRTMDPHHSTTISHFLEPRQVYDTLVTWDEKGEKIVPELASEWRLVDPTTVELKLRDDVKFHNGDSFTAETVKANIDRVFDPKSARITGSLAGRLVTVAGSEVVNSTTVRIKTKSPDPLLLNRLTMLFIAPEKLIRNDTNLDQNPIGSGPLKVTDWKELSHVNMVAHDASWRGPTPIKSARIVGIPEMGALIAALQAGDIDIGFTVAPDRVNDLRTQFNIATQPNDASTVMTMFTTKPIFADKRVRQAFNYAVDKEALLKAVNGGIGRVGQGQVIEPGVEGFNEAIKAYPFDPERARSLLRAAGVGNATVSIDSSQTIRPVTEAVSGFLNNVGITLKLQVWEPVVFIQRHLGGTDADMIHWQAHWWHLRAFDAAADKFAIKAPYRHFENDEFADLFLKARAEMDTPRRAGYTKQAIALMHEEAPVIFLPFEDIVNAFSKKIERLPMSYDRTIHLWKVEKAAS